MSDYKLFGKPLADATDGELRAALRLIDTRQVEALAAGDFDAHETIAKHERELRSELLRRAMNANPITGDLRPEWRNVIGRSAEGYQLLHIGEQRFNGNARFIREFVQAESPDDHHFRVDVSLFDGDLERAKAEAITSLAAYIESRK